MEDAEQAIVLIGSSAGTAKDAVDELRAERREGGPDQDPRRSVPSPAKSWPRP